MAKDTVAKELAKQSLAAGNMPAGMPDNNNSGGGGHKHSALERALSQMAYSTAVSSVWMKKLIRKLKGKTAAGKPKAGANKDNSGGGGLLGGLGGGGGLTWLLQFNFINAFQSLMGFCAAIAAGIPLGQTGMPPVGYVPGGNASTLSANDGAAVKWLINTAQDTGSILGQSIAASRGETLVGLLFATNGSSPWRDGSSGGIGQIFEFELMSGLGGGGAGGGIFGGLFGGGGAVVLPTHLY